MVYLKRKTFMAKPGEVALQCYLIDAKDKILGRVATRAAHIIRGKHKPQFTPNADTGDMVVIINAEKIRVTGKKMSDKIYQKYSGFHSGQKDVTLQDMLIKRPTQVMRLAVNRMLPRKALGFKLRTKLRIYTGDKHPHAAQKPILLNI